MFLQGRGPKTNAFTHSLETNHHMFMKLDNGKVSLCIVQLSLVNKTVFLSYLSDLAMFPYCVCQN